ncbi:MAG: DDE-type integrase/transposase/recombinase, partial [Pseudomonadota bacterium]
MSGIPTDEGWLYLAAVKDMATMEIVGSAMSDRRTARLAIDALIVATGTRRPPPGLSHRSGRGVQYDRDDHRKLLERHKTKASMSRKGTCLDTAPIASFFSSLKTEPVNPPRFQPRSEAKAALVEYIEIFYNRHRVIRASATAPPKSARTSSQERPLDETATRSGTRGKPCPGLG